MPICIYCLAEKPAAAFSREHVLTRAFCGQGENWTLRELVCAECNNKLSKFEAHWTSSAIESVMRNASGPRGRTAKSGERSQPVEIDELYLVQGDDPLVYEAGFAFPTEFYFRPQLIESKDGLIGVAADQRGGDALEAMMAAEVRKVPIIVTEPLPVPEDVPPKFMVHEIGIDIPNHRFILQRSRESDTPEGIWLRALEPGAVLRDARVSGFPCKGRGRLITRRLALDDRGRLFIRAAGVGDVPGFFDRFLERGKPLPMPRQYQPGEQTVRPRVRIRLPLVFRCVLKTGFNLLAHSCGRSAATDPAFDVLRRELFDRSQDASIMRRCRFLGMRPWWLAWLPDSFPAPGTDTQHRMMLDIYRGRLRFRLRLYGYLGYIADLGSVSAALAPRIPTLRVIVDHGTSGMRRVESWPCR